MASQIAGFDDQGRCEVALAEARERSITLRQELACELQVAVELQGRLAKVRSEVEATRRSIDLELREAAAAKAKLLEAKRKRRDFEKQRQQVELENGSGGLERIPEGEQEDQATLLVQARRMLSQHAGADLEAAGANMASLTEAREAATIVEQLENLGHEDDELYRALLQLSLQGLERHLDADNPEVLARVHSLAVSLENLGERSTAAKLYRRAYDGRCKRLGKDHRDALDSGLNLAACCRNSGNEKEACELFKALQEGCQRVLGPHHLVTLETTEQLADLLLSSDVVAAWKLRRQLLESYRSAYGEDDPSALGAMAKLAHVLATAASKGCASVTAASEALKASLARQRQVLGGNSPEAMKAEDDLRKFLSKNGHRPPA